MSDLHLEADPTFQAEVAPDADVLVLAGDIGSYQAGSHLPAGASRDYGLGQFRAKSHGGKWQTVLFCPGNHEYDGADFDSVNEELRLLTGSLGIQWLERQTVVVDGVRFLGTTLWSDFDALASIATDASIDRRQLLSDAMQAAARFLENSAARRNGRPLLAEEVRKLGLECQAWLRAALAEHFDGPTVVVSHFGPSLRSSDPRYGNVASTASFCNSVEDLMAQADVWIHGHLHWASNYSVPAPGRIGNECRIVCNPLGLVYKDEQRNFIPRLTVRIPASS